MSIDTAFTKFPTLRTQRFILRQVRPSDAESLFEIYSDPEAMQFYGSKRHESIEHTRELIERLHMRYSQRGGLNWVVTTDDDDTAIGACSFHHFDSAYSRVETGYSLKKTHWGQGIMAEAMIAVLDFGFRDLELHRIEAIIDDANGRSKGLLLKLGFTYEGNLRQRYWLNDHFEDEYYYGLLRSEWMAKHTANGSAG